MCVIFIADKVRPTPSMVERAFNANPDGGGAAWREDGEVKWKKDLSVEEMVEMSASLPSPYVLHFRIASVGGKRAVLTHPFPVSEEVSLALEGSTKGYVLFHNGHWSDWKKELKDAALKTGVKINVGKWSDSRAMAYLAHVYGIGIIELLENEKAVAFSPEDCEIFQGPGWKIVNDVWCSNDFWINRGTSSRFDQGSFHATDTRPMCKYGNCTRRDIDADKLCDLHRKKEGKVIEGKVVESATVHTVHPTTPSISNPLALAIQKPGGASAGIPFGVILAAYKSGKMSKNTFKKLRKAFSLLKGLELEAMKEKLQGVH